MTTPPDPNDPFQACIWPDPQRSPLPDPCLADTDPEPEPEIEHEP